jgi:hypothetical protein
MGTAMTTPDRTNDSIRDRILKLLSSGERSSIESDETRQRLANGDEYLDLERLHEGVQRVRGASPPTGPIVPRKAINEDSWRRVLRQLIAPVS